MWSNLAKTNDCCWGKFVLLPPLINRTEKMYCGVVCVHTYNIYTGIDYTHMLTIFPSFMLVILHITLDVILSFVYKPTAAKLLKLLV